VSSGSDDGNFFIWSKTTGRLTGIYEGDQGVVNVVEDRPGYHSFPMLAVSGLDNTVKVRELHSIVRGSGPLSLFLDSFSPHHRHRASSAEQQKQKK
jgi:WD40 repeat protein